MDSSKKKRKKKEFKSSFFKTIYFKSQAGDTLHFWLGQQILKDQTSNDSVYLSGHSALTAPA